MFFEMNRGRPTYHGQDLALVIPTKDRPQKMRNFLNSLVQQEVICGRIIIVNGGQSIEEMVMSFSGRLPVEYYECHPPGQIRQRNMGIALLDERTRLVGFLDDDIVLESGALEHMIAFWNRTEPHTAGVSFNITNQHSTLPKWAKGFFAMLFPRQGKVLPSGYQVSIENVRKDLKAQWLCGGATVWKQRILRDYANREISSRWAIGEDLIFSYPIGKRFPLYVCADARVRHEHVYDHKVDMRHRYYGRTVMLWRLYFVESHKELSRKLFFLMASAEMIMRLTIGVLMQKRPQIDYALGLKEGMVLGMKAGRDGSSLLSLIDEGGDGR